MELDFKHLIRNMKLIDLSGFGYLNVCGSLFFTKEPQIKLPYFYVELSVGRKYYEANEVFEIKGNISDMFINTVELILKYIRENSGNEKIKRAVIEELVTNAIVHRCYYTEEPIKIRVGGDFLEIKNPIHIKQLLTKECFEVVAAIEPPNPTIASYARSVLPYNGLKFGIEKVITDCHDIKFWKSEYNRMFNVVVYF